MAKYISSPDEDIYSVSGLPEEVVAVIFAYVSRSPLSFKENIAKVLEEEQHGRERAGKFHEKWVLNYGHASVAEHASVHLGVERVSRLFSSVLELCGEHLSFTEYSQRYQRPRRGDFVIPPEIEGDADLAKEFARVCGVQYDIYERLNAVLFDFLKTGNPGGQTDSALEKIAFEDARYALGLAYMTNLGMTANARAVEDCLSKLLSSPYGEARARAEDMKREARFSVPTLVKYASENPYLVASRRAAADEAQEFTGGGGEADKRAPHVRLPEAADEADALRRVAAALLYGHTPAGEEPLAGITKEKAERVFAAATAGLGKHDNPPDALKLVAYRAEFTVSEACWHQLLRHRKAEWFPKDPSVSFGVTVPPNIRAAGGDAEGLLLKAARESGALFERLKKAGRPLAAHYAVTNAHNRKVMGCFSLWELYHLINLRMSEGAQWDIKETVRALAEEAGRVHPVLTAPAIKRVR